MRTSRTTAQPYFVGPVTDSLFIGAASLVTFMIFAVVPQAAASTQVGWWVVIGLWVCNYPHFASTNYRLYASRESRRQYPITAYAVPALMAVAVLACFAIPRLASDLVLVYFLWAPYHFTAQTIGVTMIYVRRSGLVLSTIERRCLLSLAWSSYLASIAHGQSDPGTYHYFGVAYRPLGVSPWIAGALGWGVWACLIAVAGVLISRLMKRQDPIRLIVLVPVAAQFVWFTSAPLGYWIALIPFFHCLQYLFIAWNYQLTVVMADRDHENPTKFAVTETVRWASLNLALAFLLFWCLPQAGGLLGRSLAFSTAVVLVGIQIHHFFVDGVIWKLRNPAVSQPLMSNLAALTARHVPHPRPRSASARTVAALTAGTATTVD